MLYELEVLKTDNAASCDFAGVNDVLAQAKVVFVTGACRGIGRATAPRSAVGRAQEARGQVLWHKTADEILDSIKRYLQRTNPAGQ